MQISTYPSADRSPRRPKAAKVPKSLLAAGLTLAMLPPLPLATRAPRRIVTRSGNRVRGINLAVPASPKVEWESPLEQSAIVILRLCKSVARIFSQPLVLEVGGMQYTPDLLVFLNDGRRIWIECKPDSNSLDEEMSNKLALVKALFHGVGDRFVILDRALLDEDSPVLDNCRYLLGWLGRASSMAALPNEEATYGELLSRYGAERVNAALADGFFCFDMAMPLTRQTRVSPCFDGGAHELAFLNA